MQERQVRGSMESQISSLSNILGNTQSTGGSRTIIAREDSGDRFRDDIQVGSTVLQKPKQLQESIIDEEEHPKKQGGVNQSSQFLLSYDQKQNLLS